MRKLRSVLAWLAVGVAVVASSVGTECFKTALLAGGDKTLAEIMLCVTLVALTVALALALINLSDQSDDGKEPPQLPDSAFGVWGFGGGYSGSSPATEQKCGQCACRCSVHDAGGDS